MKGSVYYFKAILKRHEHEPAHEPKLIMNFGPFMVHEVMCMVALQLQIEMGTKWLMSQKTMARGLRKADLC